METNLSEDGFIEMSLSAIDLPANYRQWRAGTGIFECYMRANPFVSLKHYSDFTLRLDEPALPIAKEWFSTLIAGQDWQETLMLIDLPGTVSVSLGYWLQKLWSIKPILVFNHSLHPAGMVGDRTFIKNLLAGGLHLPNTKHLKGFAFILDYDRYRDVSEEAYLTMFNNQYQLTEEDLPELEILNAHGVKQVLVVTPELVKEDLDGYLAYIRGNGISVILQHPQEVLELER